MPSCLQHLGDKKAELLVMHKTGIDDMEHEYQVRKREVHGRQPGILEREMALDGLLASAMMRHGEVRTVLHCNPS